MRYASAANFSEFEKGKITALFVNFQLSLLEISSQIKRSFTVIHNFINKAENYGANNKHARKRWTSHGRIDGFWNKISTQVMSWSASKSQLYLSITPRTILNMIDRSPATSFMKMVKKDHWSRTISKHVWTGYIKSLKAKWIKHSI